MSGTIPSLEVITKEVYLTNKQKEMLNQFWPESHRFLDHVELENLKQKGIVYDTPINPTTTEIVDTICTIKNAQGSPCFESKQENNYSTLVE
jgi:hypothetical protein